MKVVQLAGIVWNGTKIVGGAVKEGTWGVGNSPGCMYRVFSI